MDICLPKLNIYEGTVAPNCFRSHTTPWCPDFFRKNFLSDVRSEIHLVRRNIVSTGQSVQALKKIYSGLRNDIFFFIKLSQGNFLYCPKFFTLAKNLNISRTRTETKQNLLH